MEFGTLFFFIFFLGLCIFKIRDFLEAFLIIESLSFIAYILAGFEKDTKMAASVGIQYLIIGSISSIFLVLSLLLVYYQFSTTSLLNLSILDLSSISSVLDKPNLLLELEHSTFCTFNTIDTTKNVLEASNSYLSESLFNIHNSHNIFQESLWKPLNMDFNPSASMFVEDYKPMKDWLGYSYLNEFDFTHVNLFYNLADGHTSFWLFSENSSYWNAPLNNWYLSQSLESQDLTCYKLYIEEKTEKEITSFFTVALAIKESEKKLSMEDWPDVIESPESSASDWMADFLKQAETPIDFNESLKALSAQWSTGLLQNINPIYTKLPPITPVDIGSGDSLKHAFLTNFDQGLSEVFLIPKVKKSELPSRIKTDLDSSTQIYTEKFNEYADFAVNFNVNGFLTKNFLQNKFNNIINLPKLSLDHVEGSVFIYNSLRLPTSSIPYFGKTDWQIFKELTYDGPSFDFFFNASFLDAMILKEKDTMDSHLLNWGNYFTQNYQFTFVDSFIFGVLVVSLSFLMGTLLYKIKGAPFHIWAPTIYTRMPTGSMVILITTFTLIFSLYFFQLFFSIFSMYEIIFSQIFVVAGLLSLIFGFLGAFDQKILKKFFVFSSIGHVAFLLFTFISQSSFKNGTLLVVYLLIYILSTILLWYLVTFNNTKIDFLTNLLKKIKTNSFFYFIFIIIVFSMSGIPPLAGFYIKFDVLSILINCNEFFILFLSLLITVASFYYYLRLLKIATFENFEPILFNPLNVEKFWLFIRLSFLFIFIPLLLCFPLVFEQSFFYFFSYSNLY